MQTLVTLTRTTKGGAMRTLVLVTEDDGDIETVVGRRAGPLARIAAHLRAGTLDRRLAEGVAPEGGVGLALRAQALVAPQTRLQLAEPLRRLADEARSGTVGGARSARAPVRLPVVLGAVDELEELAARLLDPGPLPVSGLAGARLLLTDGTGPLYDRASSWRLQEALAAVLDRLRTAGPIV
jgi:hypothetical protein